MLSFIVLSEEGALLGGTFTQNLSRCSVYQVFCLAVAMMLKCI